MIKEKPFIHLFNTPKGYYIFDVNTNAILKIKKEAYELLKKVTFCQGFSDDLYKSYCEDKTIKNLRENGFLSSKKVKEVIHPYDRVLEYYMSRNLKMITLQVTQQCNLRCEYCAYSGIYANREHKNVKMSLETAKKGIEFFIENSIDVETVNIGFYGGEPLLEFDLVKDAILYAKSISEGKKTTFSFTTNGTLFTKEIIEFMMLHDVMITISLDGPREVHDKNRKFAVSGCGSFDKVIKNLDFFKKNYPEYFKKILFNTVLDNSNNFNCLNEFFTTYDAVKDSMITSFEVAKEYSLVDTPPNEEYDTQLRYEIFKMYLSKLNRVNEKSVSKLVEKYYDSLKDTMLNKRKLMTQLSDKAHHGGPCIPGAHRLFMDVDGNFYPCERVSENSEPMHIGHVDTGFNYEKIRRLLNVGELTKESCINCWAFSFCSLCAAYADNLDELSKEKKVSNCNLVRASLDYNLKDYCMFNEFGYPFDENSYLIIGG